MITFTLLKLLLYLQNFRSDTFTLLKYLISNKKENLSDKFTPLVPNDIFVLSDFEESTENEGEDDSSNVALSKFIESNREYLRKFVDGTSKYIIFSERLEALRVLPSKKLSRSLRRN